MVTAEQRRARNAGYQARWRAKRDALAREAFVLRQMRAGVGDDADAFIRELEAFERDYGWRFIDWAARLDKPLSRAERHEFVVVANRLFMTIMDVLNEAAPLPRNGRGGSGARRRREGQ